MRGEADYSYLEDRIIILGWQGLHTRRMVEEIIADVGATRREIVICTTKDIENPMPDHVKFVRDKAMGEAGLHNRAGSAGDAEVTPGDVLYYIAATRLDPAQVNWRAVA